jgi:hypothetical protein
MTKVLHVFRFAAAIGFAAASALSMAADQGDAKGGAVVVTQSGHAKATVVDIKKKERELTLRDEQGNEVVVVASNKIRNFAQIEKGDVIEVDYQRAAASELEKISDTNAASATTDVQRAPAGAKPGMRARHTSSIIATVVEIDLQKRLLTVQGPKGGIVTIEVPAAMKAFDSLKKGDKISAVYTEAIAISVKSPEKKK